MISLLLDSAWRWSAAVEILVGFQVTDGMYIGYGDKNLLN
jgi:hypothetical protein